MHDSASHAVWRWATVAGGHSALEFGEKPSQAPRRRTASEHDAALARARRPRDATQHSSVSLRVFLRF